MSMYPSVIHLLVAYGICFGLQNNLPVLRNRQGWLDALLSCSYCTGFHAGWQVWFLNAAVTGSFPGGGFLSVLVSVLCWAFGSAAFCYLVDVAATRLEK